MNEQSNQPDLIDRQLIPARSRVSLSREIGEAVITENIFGTAKVRIIRKNDKYHRAIWMVVMVAGVGIAAAAAWQGWVASQQTETVADAVQAAPLSVDAAENATASQSEATATFAEPPQASVPTVAPVQAVRPPPPVVAPAKPVQRQPEIVQPQLAPQTGLLSPPHFATSLPPKPASIKPMQPKPVVASDAVAAPVIKPQAAASSPVVAKPLSSPLASETVSAPDKQAAETSSPQNN